MLTPKDIASMLDHSTLQQFLTDEDIRKGCEIAIKYGTATVCARPQDMKLVSSLLKVYTQETGLEGYPICIGGGTYAKAIPNILACGPIFPGDEIREHKADEYISIESLVKNAQIIAAAMYELAK